MSFCYEYIDWITRPGLPEMKPQVIMGIKYQLSTTNNTKSELKY